jgi:catechol 2,3-dioxygenase-like lactoylglutathione lyase family enzyme
MPNLRVVELKAFIPTKDYELSKQFYSDIGFTLKSDGGGVAYFSHGNASFLLQNFYSDPLASNLTMHLLVEDVDAWRAHLEALEIATRYGVEITDIQQQPWRMRDFVLTDPCGVEWTIAQNTP